MCPCVYKFRISVTMIDVNSKNSQLCIVPFLCLSSYFPPAVMSKVQYQTKDQNFREDSRDEMLSSKLNVNPASRHRLPQRSNKVNFREHYTSGMIRCLLAHQSQSKNRQYHKDELRKNVNSFRDAHIHPSREFEDEKVRNSEGTRA